jgi:hypothetical protein
MRRVELKAIDGADLQAVGEFLHTHLNHRVSAERWATCLKAPWDAHPPNHGYMLLDGGSIVGVYLAFYSERTLEGRMERFCNLAAWCVLPKYRFHSVRLLKALLAQPDYSFTDLSPSGNAVHVNVGLKFEFLDTTAKLVVNLPWPARFSKDTVDTDPSVIDRVLTGRDKEIYRDHVRACAAHHIVLRRGSDVCYVMFRHERRKRLPIFVSLLYVSNPTLFRTMIRAFSRHVLLRHGALATLVDQRIVPFARWPAVALRRTRPKMFKSPRLGSAHIDYLYSELACVPW